MTIDELCDIYMRTHADATHTGVVDPFPCAVDAVAEAVRVETIDALLGRLVGASAQRDVESIVAHVDAIRRKLATAEAGALLAAVDDQRFELGPIVEARRIVAEADAAKKDP